MAVEPDFEQLIRNYQPAAACARSQARPNPRGADEPPGPPTTIALSQPSSGWGTAIAPFSLLPKPFMQHASHSSWRP